MKPSDSYPCINMDTLIPVKIMRINPEQNADIPIPFYASEGAAGMDLCAAIKTSSMGLLPNQIETIPTGFAMEIPQGFEAQIRPRSGLAFKHGITIINAPGTIDSDFRGEIKVGLINLSNRKYTLRRKDRIAQIVFKTIQIVSIQEVDELNTTKRGNSGFGSTGL